MINQNFLKTLNVLYVEDSKTIREQFTGILNKLFDNVVIARNGREAIDKFTTNQDEDFDINIVISDINMPFMDGMELLELIREIDSDIPFILTTAHTESDFLINAIRFKATDYLVKPVNIKDLIQKAQTVCQERYHDNIKKQTQEELQQITNVINEVALVSKTDLRGTITYANKLFCRVSGYKKNEIIGQTHAAIIHPSGKNDDLQNLNKDIQLGNIWEGKIHNITKNAEDYHVSASVIPLYDEFDADIIEFMWICFLTTEDEVEKKEFKKKVAINVKETRRINVEARKSIDELEARLLKYKHFDLIEYSLEVEKKRSAKFKNQIKYYEKEVDNRKSKFELMSQEANRRIKKANLLSQEQSDKKDLAIITLESLTKELEVREGDVGILNKEIENQINLIEDLKSSIEAKEEQLGTGTL
ncbi:MAG: response regulator [Campylobacteraceae bacterium]|nr:response regulator [Campylobacteraceae bacterium]